MKMSGCTAVLYTVQYLDTCAQLRLIPHFHSTIFNNQIMHHAAFQHWIGWANNSKITCYLDSDESDWLIENQHRSLNAGAVIIGAQPPTFPERPAEFRIPFR